jgi:hypothetical protein
VEYGLTEAGDVMLLVIIIMNGKTAVISSGIIQGAVM